MAGLQHWIAGHRKVLVAVAGAAVTVAVQAWGTSNPYVSLAVLAATSLGVYRLPNRPAPPATPPVTMPPVTSSGYATGGSTLSTSAASAPPAPPSGDVKVIPPEAPHP